MFCTEEVHSFKEVHSALSVFPKLLATFSQASLKYRVWWGTDLAKYECETISFRLCSVHFLPYFRCYKVWQCRQWRGQRWQVTAVDQSEKRNLPCRSLVTLHVLPLWTQVIRTRQQIKPSLKDCSHITDSAWIYSTQRTELSNTQLQNWFCVSTRHLSKRLCWIDHTWISFSFKVVTKSKLRKIIIQSWFQTTNQTNFLWLAHDKGYLKGSLLITVETKSYTHSTLLMKEWTSMFIPV